MCIISDIDDIEVIEIRQKENTSRAKNITRTVEVLFLGSIRRKIGF